jgi:alpha-2-macroglobulin
VQEWRYSQRTAALRALTRVGSLDEHYLVDLFQLRERLDIQSLADLASTMSTQPTRYRSNLEALRKELWDSVIIKLRQGKPVFEGLQWRRASWGGYGFLSSQPSSVAAVLEALVRIDPKDERLELLRDALLSYASADLGFGSTYENRRALGALALYLEKGRPAVADTTVALSSGANLQVGAARKTASTEVAGDAPLTATVKGGPVGVRVEARYVPATPGHEVGASKQGFIVSRGATWLHADGSEATHFEDKAGEVKELKVGDILELHARIVSEEDRNHVALVVPFAAGLEPLNPELANASSEARPFQVDSLTPAYVQRLDDEVRYYFLRLPRGTHTFHFRVRAATEGSFVHPAPFAELMYRQSVRGRGEGMRIMVKGAHEQ